MPGIVAWAVRWGARACPSRGRRVVWISQLRFLRFRGAGARGRGAAPLATSQQGIKAIFFAAAAEVAVVGEAAVGRNGAEGSGCLRPTFVRGSRRFTTRPRLRRFSSKTLPLFAPSLFSLPAPPLPRARGRPLSRACSPHPRRLS